MLLVDRAHHVHHAHLARHQLQRIDVNHRLAILAAEYSGDFGAFHYRDLIANLKLRQIVKLRFCQTLALDGDQRDRETRRVELQHHRRKRARRQAFEVRHGQVG